jgi:hypothetical protein
MNDLNHYIEEVERHEQNLADFEDLRFAEIFLTDKENKSERVALQRHVRSKRKRTVRSAN